MKYLFLPLLIASATLLAQAQTKATTEEILRNVADHVIDSTSFQFVNNKTGEKFESTKGRDTSNNVKAESRYNKWAYVNGVLTVGMVELSKILNDKKYSECDTQRTLNDAINEIIDHQSMASSHRHDAVGSE